MSLRAFQPRVMSSPRGEWSSLLNRRTGTPARAANAQNIRIRFGTARSRAGTTAVFNTTGKVTGMFNWLTPSGQNLVLYQDATAIKSYNQATATAATLLTGVTTARAPVFAPLDVWTYFCGFDTASNGAYQCRIFDSVNTDVAFRGAPVITGWSAADGGAGYCTQGQHFIGFVYQNRTGYAGIPVTGISYPITATTNSSPDVLTAPGNNLQNDQQITISGATGDTAINGTRIVTNVAGADFQLTDTDGNVINGNGAYTGGGIVTNPIQFTTTAGLRQINVSVPLPAQPDGGTSATGGVQATLFLIATRADNPALWYFIPTDAQTGQIGEQPVPYNTPVTLNFVFSLSDEDIANSLAGDTAQKNFLFLAQDAGGNGPFNPSFVVAYGQRMCYGVGTTMYVSDINAPQQIAADTNQVRMPNQRQIGMGFPLPGGTSFYLTGDHWTSFVNDNSDSPSTWSEPILISDALGAPFPNCVCFATGGNYVWIVTESGPYYFDGQYQGNQLLYLVTGLDESGAPTGWNRVNWNAAYAIQIRDDVANRKLYVAVPLDGATECNYMFVIDYRMGLTFESVDISLDLFNPQLFSSIAVIKEVATGRSNLWIGPAVASSVTHFDIEAHNDLGNAIKSIWRSGMVRKDTSPMIRVGYLDIWARGHAPLDLAGNPTFLMSLISQDNQTTLPLVLQSNMGVAAALVDAPGLQYSAKTDLNHLSNYTVEFSTNAVDAWFELSSFSAWEFPDLTNR